MKTTLIFLLTVLSLCTASARAEIWGFVDENGEAHMADRKIDNRYSLFQRGNDESKAQEPAVASTSGKLPNANPVRIAERHVEPYRKLVASAAAETRVDPKLLHAIISVESGYQPRAVSPKGAVGLMQVMPGTGARFGVRQLANPKENIKAGARYVKFLLGMFNNNLPLVIAAYNAGEGAVQKYRNRIPPYRETQNYVARVLASYRHSGGQLVKSSDTGAGRVHVLISPQL
jgi:soluble lytic murein transglycosylase-like protein